MKCDADPPALCGVRIELVVRDGDLFGLGQATLLERIGETGSIAEAGRRLGNSCKFAWTQVQALNARFSAPLVESSRGGRGHGGARLTPTGSAVLESYRSAEKRVAKAAAREMGLLAELSSTIPERK